MQTLRYKIILRLTKLLNILAMAVPFGACWFLRYAETVYGTEPGGISWLILAVFILLYVTYGRIYDCFSITRSRISEMIYSQSLSLLMADGLLYVTMCLIAHGFVSPVELIMTLCVQLLISVCWCTLVHIWYFKTFPPQKDCHRLRPAAQCGAPGQRLWPAEEVPR